MTLPGNINTSVVYIVLACIHHQLFQPLKHAEFVLIVCGRQEQSRDTFSMGQSGIAFATRPEDRRVTHAEVGTIDVTIVVETAIGAAVQALPIERSGSRWQARVGPTGLPNFAKRSHVANRNRTVAVHIEQRDSTLGEPLIAEA